jgi:hypothetical protein
LSREKGGSWKSENVTENMPHFEKVIQDKAHCLKINPVESAQGSADLFNEKCVSSF